MKKEDTLKKNTEKDKKKISKTILKAPVYNQAGEIIRQIDLPVKVFAAKWRADLVHQVVLSMRSNKRAGTADAKDRSEVRGGGKKPWKQKGTGRARHGSSRSPIWVGGGVAHGPLAEKNYKRKITHKSKIQAFFSVLTKKYQDQEVIFIDSLDLKEIKTKTALGFIKNLAKEINLKFLINTKKPKILLALFSRNEKIEKSFRNLPQLEIVFVKNLNSLDILNYQYLLIENPEASIEFFANRG